MNSTCEGDLGRETSGLFDHATTLPQSPCDPSTPSIHDSGIVRGRTMVRKGSNGRSLCQSCHQAARSSNVDLNGHLSTYSQNDSCDDDDGGENNTSVAVPGSRHGSSSQSTSDGARSVVALVSRASGTRQELPVPVFKQILQHLDYQDYLSVRLVCRQWSSAARQCRPPQVDPIFFSPPEILQQILQYLSPWDFDAARHTSKAWMLASLDKNLLTIMIKRGGWSLASLQDTRQALKSVVEPSPISDEWLLSKRLATECAFGSDANECKIQSSAMPLQLSTVVDFSDLGGGYTSGGQSAVNITVSGCGKYVLIAEGCVVYVYRLLNARNCHQTFAPPLQDVTSIICPRRVLAVSMDTSAQRFAVAALLEGRMGVVCDVQGRDDVGDSKRLAKNLDFAVGPSSAFQKVTVRDAGSHGERVELNPAIVGTERSTPAKLPVSSGQRRSVNRFQTIVPEQGIAVENGPRSVYRNLCSNEDPPRSVAICPQRRCVAFGCAAGIELHWVDALTGQDLNRWFPLAAPSDFLFFLPPRRGIDSAKKLRLISSAAHPHKRPSIMNRFHPTSSRNSFFGNIPIPSAADRSLTPLRSVDCDHYHAIPLSDGYHMLFTDPATEYLCLGSDAPLGGPTKLLRRFVMIPPPSVPEGTAPGLYASGTDLRWGIRIAASYNNTIVLFSIPTDIFEDARADKVFPPASEQMDDNRFWHDYYYSSPSALGANPTTGLWPVRINGVEIGQLEGIVDFAVVAGPTVSISAFCGRTAEAVVWDVISSPGVIRINRAVVCADGRVNSLQDTDGDINMRDVSISNLEYGNGNGQCPGFDGTDSGFPNRSTNVVHFLTACHGSTGDGDAIDDGLGRDLYPQDLHGGRRAAGHSGLDMNIHIPGLESGWNRSSTSVNGADIWLEQYLGHATAEDGWRVLGFEGLDLEVL